MKKRTRGPTQSGHQEEERGSSGPRKDPRAQERVRTLTGQSQHYSRSSPQATLSVPTAPLCSRCHHYPQFTDGETEDWWQGGACPGASVLPWFLTLCSPPLLHTAPAACTQSPPGVGGWGWLQLGERGPSSPFPQPKASGGLGDCEKVSTGNESQRQLGPRRPEPTTPPPPVGNRYHMPRG